MPWSGTRAAIVSKVSISAATGAGSSRSIGRTDLPGGDEEAIYESIARRLYSLPGEQAVYPGHGLATTIGEERRLNPFVQAEGAAR